MDQVLLIIDQVVVTSHVLRSFYFRGNYFDSCCHLKGGTHMYDLNSPHWQNACSSKNTRRHQRQGAKTDYTLAVSNLSVRRRLHVWREHAMKQTERFFDLYHRLL